MLALRSSGWRSRASLTHEAKLINTRLPMVLALGIYYVQNQSRRFLVPDKSGPLHWKGFGPPDRVVRRRKLQHSSWYSRY